MKKILILLLLLSVSVVSHAGKQSFSRATFGDGSGASSLSDLTDVNTATATYGNLLVADGTDWESVSTITVDAANGRVGIGTTVPTQQLELTESMELPDTTHANEYGVIYKNGKRFIHNFNYGYNGTVTTAGRNTFIGEEAGNLTMGSTATSSWFASYNTAMGIKAFYSNTIGFENSTIGAYSLHYNTTGSKNSIFGVEAGKGQENLSDISNNTIIGYHAGKSVLTGADNNILIGYQAANALTTGANNIIIGYDIDAPTVDGDGQMSIGNLIYGVGLGTTGTDVSTGKVGIGTSNPSTILDINGDLTLTSGTLVSTNTTDIGWTNQAGANTACNTTCVSACVFGFDDDTDTIVNCADATADKCICAGGS